MEFTLEELQCIASMLIKEKAKADYNIDELESKFTDYVTLYESHVFKKYTAKRELLSGLMVKMINLIATEQVRAKTVMN